MYKTATYKNYKILINRALNPFPCLPIQSNVELNYPLKNFHQ